MKLNKILENEAAITKIAVELGFSKEVKLYLGPQDILYLLVEPDQNKIKTEYFYPGRISGLKCELTDLCKCQVAVVQDSDFSELEKYDVSAKSALLVDKPGLENIFGDLTKFEIEDADVIYLKELNESRRIYERFKIAQIEIETKKLAVSKKMSEEITTNNFLLATHTNQPSKSKLNYNVVNQRQSSLPNGTNKP